MMRIEACAGAGVRGCSTDMSRRGTAALRRGNGMRTEACRKRRSRDLEEQRRYAVQPSSEGTAAICGQALPAGEEAASGRGQGAELRACANAHGAGAAWQEMIKTGGFDHGSEEALAGKGAGMLFAGTVCFAPWRNGEGRRAPEGKGLSASLPVPGKRRQLAVPRAVRLLPARALLGCAPVRPAGRPGCACRRRSAVKGLGRRQGAVALRPAHQGEVSTMVRKKERVASSAKKRAALFLNSKST